MARGGASVAGARRHQNAHLDGCAELVAAISLSEKPIERLHAGAKVQVWEGAGLYAEGTRQSEVVSQVERSKQSSGGVRL